MNNQIFFFLYSFAHRSDILDKVIFFFANTFPYFVVIFAVFFLIFHHDAFLIKNNLSDLRNFFKKIHEIVFVFFLSGIAWCFAYVLKNIFKQPRPFVAFQNIHALIPETGYAFPSQHAILFSALAVSLYFCHKKVGYLFMFFALLIGVARIMAGVHFPIDILGGFILGTFISISVKKFFD